VLLIYSDGVTEAFDEDGEEFGEARVHELAAKHRQATAGEIHEHILQAVETHRAGGRATDDRTIIVLRRS
jgi:sigma-B regulation protein RsbU (phosphoserine phosphatase)